MGQTMDNPCAGEWLSTLVAFAVQKRIVCFSAEATNVIKTVENMHVTDGEIRV
jgi:hypothetical protein